MGLLDSLSESKPTVFFASECGRRPTPVAPPLTRLFTEDSAERAEEDPAASIWSMFSSETGSASRTITEPDYGALHAQSGQGLSGGQFLENLPACPASAQLSM